MTKDFGLAGVTDKLKQIKGESDTVTQINVKSNTGEPITGEPITGEPITGEHDFRQEALAKLNNPSATVLQRAIETAKRKPRIGVYSPIVSAAVEYLREAIPKYSASDEARKILEDVFEKRYPELIKQIKSGME